jgi:glucan phosphorylase
MQVERFNDTEQAFDEVGARRLYYLSLEFLMGRALSNSVYCLGLVSISVRIIHPYTLNPEPPSATASALPRPGSWVYCPGLVRG